MKPPPCLRFRGIRRFRGRLNRSRHSFVFCFTAFSTYPSRIELLIRQATIDDLDVIARFNVALASESEQLALDPGTVKAGVDVLLRDPSKGAYFVAVCAGQVVGQIMITHEWSDWHNGDYWWLQSVYVHPEFRRLGIFKALFNFLCERARATPGVCCIRLYMEVNNKRARAAYTGVGMTETRYTVFERPITK